MDCILAIDVGTQSLRACIVDADLSVVEREQIPYVPRVRSRNRVEMDAERLWEALVRACDGLRQKDRVRAVSLSTLCPSLVAMDEDGNPLHPVILHLDRRSYRQSQWALSRVDEEVFLNVAGNLPIPGGVSVTSLLWIRDNEPDVYNRKGVRFGHAVTFFLKRFTGRFAIDPSNASFTGLYNTVGHGDWDDRLTEPLGIDRAILPEVIDSATVVGELDGGVARALGLPAGVPVVIGANDTTCAAVGAGVVEEGAIMNTSGTVEILVLCLEKPIVSRDHLLRTHAWPGKWLAMRTVGAGGASLEWFRANFCREMTRETFYNDYLTDALAPDRAPESVFHPYLSGDRHRIKSKSASFTRLTLNTTREDMLLALTRGIIDFQIRGFREWERKVRLQRRIYHVGGGASDAYTRYKQRMLKAYRFEQLGETTIAGSARLAMEALAAARKLS